MDFTSALTRAYLANPCRILPNALWKTLENLENCQAAFRAGEAGCNHLEIWQENRLLLCWDQDPASLVLPAGRASAIDFALIHQCDLPYLKPSLPVFSSQTAYFRLSFRGAPANHRLRNGFSFRLFNFDTDIEAAASMIERCYTNLHPSPETIRGWTRHLVFNPQVWLWVWDNANNRPAGLGIAELDKRIDEGSLEWIQVLPEYRGLGFGQALVLKLLQGMQGRASFVTVSGEVDNPSSPERLYRRCGFTGTDIWWVLK